MKLRSYQSELVEHTINKLNEHDSVLSSAPTGAGKTVCIAHIIKNLIQTNRNLKICVIGHTTEINYQCFHKISEINKESTTTLYNANNKNLTGQIVCATIQTISKDKYEDLLPFFDLLIIDEAHHVIAESYIKLIRTLKAKNKKLKIIGLTATPNRGDKVNLNKVFNAEGYHIEFSRLIEEDILVKPKVKLIETEAIRNYRERQAVKLKTKFKVDEKEVFKHWYDIARERKTIVFCTTKKHCKEVVSVFVENGIKATALSADTHKSERESILRRLDEDDIQVIVNVGVLTEGWDCPEISCIVLLKFKSHESAYIQMIGRGLRKSNSANKVDCEVLDFGISSSLIHSLEQYIDLEDKDETKNEVAHCTQVKAKEVKDSIELKSVELTTKDMLCDERSFKKLCSIFFKDTAIYTTAAYTYVLRSTQSCYTAMIKDNKTKEIYKERTDKHNAIKIINKHFSKHIRTQYWRQDEASEKQLRYLSNLSNTTVDELISIMQKSNIYYPTKGIISDAIAYFNLAMRS